MMTAVPMSRRRFIQASAALSLAAFPGFRTTAGDGAFHVAVMGAGAFGGWTALALARAGARVTLLDGWGPGHSRASSGGETRVIRGVYGADSIYTEWTARSFPVWKATENASTRNLYQRTGALWMLHGDDSYVRSSLPLMEANGLEIVSWSLDEAAKRYPQIAFDDIGSVYYEPEAGYLTAREACAVVKELAVESGVAWIAQHAEPGPTREGAMRFVTLPDGSKLEADAFVFACGPWLATLFPEVIGDRITPTRQEVFYFGVPPGEEAFDDRNFPVWVDLGERIFYGIPGNRWRGFKVADDTRGEAIDPTTMDRTPTPEKIDLARAQLGRRFPGLKNAPLVESRVCQYENSPDGDFIIDRHPEARNAFLVGGGSGHGFKLAPALGEHVAWLALTKSEPLPKFSIDRFTEAKPGKTQFGDPRR